MTYLLELRCRRDTLAGDFRCCGCGVRWAVVPTPDLRWPNLSLAPVVAECPACGAYWLFVWSVDPARPCDATLRTILPTAGCAIREVMTAMQHVADLDRQELRRVVVKATARGRAELASELVPVGDGPVQDAESGFENGSRGSHERPRTFADAPEGVRQGDRAAGGHLDRVRVLLDTICRRVRLSPRSL